MIRFRLPRRLPKELLSERPARAGFLTRAAGLVLIGCCVALAQAAGLLRPIDDGLARLRFDLLERPATGTMTVVEIDAASLRAADRWPWGRERFAQAIRNLQDAGAEVVALDVDFSARSSPGGDAALKAAVDRRPGEVVLPTFVQKAGEQGGLVESSPLDGLADQALLASVNVPVDADGRVRRYSLGFGGEDDFRPSIAALLADTPYGRTEDFLIDYGIRPTFGRLSFEDVRTGRFDPALVDGRRILIGATALELGDEFAAPKAGVMAGVHLHALAYESLMSGRALRPAHPLAILALACAVAFLLRPRAQFELSPMLRQHALVAAGAVGLPLMLQALAPVSLDAGAVLLAQGLCLIWTVRAELRRRAEAIVREREAALLHQAMHEPETGLPNRRALLEEIGRRMTGDRRRSVAVLAVGLDRVSVLRGAIGYGRFHEVVRQVASRIGEASGEPLVAHLSSSVLGVVISARTAEALRTRVRRVERLDPSLAIEDLPVDAFVRVGAAYRRRGETAETLLEHASIALDRARELDRRALAFHEAKVGDPSLNLALMSDMRRGLAAGELALHYQPKVHAKSGRVTGVEALVRWTHPSRGPIAPDLLISTAEETGMIRALTEWGIAQAVTDLGALGADGHDLTVAVNVSAGLLADRTFRERLTRAAAGRADRLCLEITESAIIRNPDEAMRAIAEFRAAGLKIAIDDYGTGLSSLSYLKLIEADELKLDKSLVAAVNDSARDRLILKSTVDLAHSLGMSVVAEGVETRSVLAALAAMGCDVVQGYLVSKALPIGELHAFLESRSRPARAA